MSNYAHAVAIITQTIKHPERAHDMVEELADAGLLAPDLPEPRVLTPETDPEWAQKQLDEWEWLPDVRFNSTTTPFYLTVKDGETDGGFDEFGQEEWFNMNPEQLREIAAILLSTADYVEEHERSTP